MYDLRSFTNTGIRKGRSCIPIAGHFATGGHSGVQTLINKINGLFVAFSFKVEFGEYEKLSRGLGGTNIELVGMVRMLVVVMPSV